MFWKKKGIKLNRYIRYFLPFIYTPSQKQKNLTHIVFISGMPRTGTTFLKSTLNKASNVFIYSEIIKPFETPLPEYFMTKTGLNEKLVNEIDNKHSAMHAEIWNISLNRNIILGAKIPGGFYQFSQLKKLFSNVKVIIFHIVRPLSEIAISYEIRSKNVDDKWSCNRGWEACISEFEQYLVQLKNIEDSKSEHFKHVFVNYEDLSNPIKLRLLIEGSLNLESEEINKMCHYANAKWSPNTKCKTSFDFYAQLINTAEKNSNLNKLIEDVNSTFGSNFRIN